MGTPLRVLVVEDSEDDALLLLRELKRAGYDTTWERVDTPEAMEAALERQTWDIVISDYAMPQFSMPAALKMLQDRELDIPFIIVSGAIGEEAAVAAMRAGARDYIMKGNLARLTPVIERELAESDLRRERRQMEEDTLRMGLQLQLAGRLAAVGELAAGVAHELNNPLAAIQAFAQFLAENHSLDEATKRDVQTIYKEAQRASRITSNLLSFARRHKPEKELIAINEIIARSLELHAYQLKVNNIEVVVEADPDLPMTMADSQQIHQVFVNLIRNAEQAMTEAHGGGTLRVEAEAVGDMIRIAFSDDGPGIPEDNLKGIFDPFFTTKGVGKGTGLGLSICYGIIQEHSGRLYATSGRREGATFVVELPIVSDNTPASHRADSLNSAA